MSRVRNVLGVYGNSQWQPNGALASMLHTAPCDTPPSEYMEDPVCGGMFMILSRKARNFFTSSGLVKKSAMLSSVLTYQLTRVCRLFEDG